MKDTTETKSSAMIQCGYTDIDFVEIGGDDKICFDSSTDEIIYTVKNVGSVDIVSQQITVIGNGTEILNTEVVYDLPVQNANSTTIAYSLATYGDIELVSIIPEIEVEDETIPCSLKELKKETIDACS